MPVKSHGIPAESRLRIWKTVSGESQPARPENRCRQGISGIGRGRQEIAGSGPRDDVANVHDPNPDRLVGAGLNASRGLTGGEPVAAEIALADDPLAGVKLGGIIGTGQRAVLAAEALVV